MLVRFRFIYSFRKRNNLVYCKNLAEKANGIIKILSFNLNKKVSLLQTTLPKFKKTLLTKGVKVTASRVSELGISLDQTLVCDHREESVKDNLCELQENGCEIALVLGASSISDRRDVIPSAIIQAGGNIQQFGPRNFARRYTATCS